ncbi:LamG-like jellyroll fold domain-containing protein [Mucilaginibacter flavidus]|uniref:LamG-like jellyroll fold domain-containing protein n=1 Tax=Mucilaginibacter flavidus TaxID=2949309 RepID=UPI002092AB80|nr:LamG-like jellyroll fold domain-containing protein [Mucilaginibacter flavidus]MCO5950926.1 T9SS type A sorting domain-containing protein [Mucilaginibacter flavidus]
MKLSDTISKKPFWFFCVLAGMIFLANSAFAARTVTISSPATGSTFGVGTSITVNATAAGFSGSISKIVFTMAPLASQTDVSGPTYSVTFATGTLTVGTTYTITATATDSFAQTATTSITVTMVPAAPTGIPGTTCGTGSVTLSASGGSPAGGSYIWYAASSGGSALQTNTSPNYTVALASNTTYYVSYKSGTFESSRTAVAATVSAAATSTFTATSTVVVGSNATITYTGSDPVTSTFTWTFDGGIIASGSGKGPYTVNWSIPGVHNVTLIVTNTAGCSSSTTTVPVTVTPVVLGDYGFMKPIVLYTSQISNGGISSTLSNFPALVYIQDNALKILNQCGDKVQFPLGNGGGLTSGTNYDFAFTVPGSTTELNYQVDTYDSVNGILLVWVRIPSATSTDVPLTFYFGSKVPAHSASWSASTWASDYKAVYHFNEASTNAAVLDATSNGRNAVQANTTVTNDEIHIAAAVPIAGGGYSFNGTSTSIIQNVGTAPNINGAFTISAWVYYAGLTTSDNKIVSNELDYGHNNNSGGYKLSVKTGSIQTETRIANGTNVGNLGTGGTVDNTGWHYIQGTFDGTATGNFKNYVDGVASTVTMAKNETTMLPSNGFMLAMGLDHGTGVVNGGYNDENFYNGKMDEVRVSNVEKTPDWIRAEYYNQTHPREFCDYGESVVTFQTNAPLLVGALTFTWTGLDGTTPTDQTKTANWDAGFTPVFNGNTKMVIPVVPSGNYPVLTADGSIYSLTIATGGAYLNLNGHTLNVGCNIYNNASTGGTGILNASNTSSAINWNGSLAAQGYYGTNTVNTAEIGNMTVNNSSAGTVTITGGPVDVYNTLTITKGNLVIDNTGSGDMTLKSSSTLSASVAAIPSTYSITGKLNVERYISGGASKYRGYRFLSSPVYTAKVGTNYYYDLSYLTSYTPTTGFFGTSGGMTKQGNPSVYLYRDNVAFTNGTFNSGNFRGVNKINNTTLYSIGVDFDGTFNLHVGTGIWLFYRGNMTNVATKFITSTVPEANVFVTRGTLNQQAVTVVNWYTQLSTLQCTAVTGNTGYAGYNLVGNPYASSIDWDKRSTTDPAAGIYAPKVNSKIYIFNESTKIYATYDGVSGVNGGSNIIPSGQGFYVKAQDATASLTFNEAAKTSVQVTGPTAATGSTLLLSTHPVGNSKPDLRYMRLELFKDSDNVEETLVRFDNSAKNEFVDNEDSEHMAGSGGVSFSSNSSDNVKLAINHVPFPKTAGTVIKLNVSATTDGQYAINRTELKDIPDIYEIWLKDAYKKDSLDIKHNSSYVFNILKSDTNSFGANRFTLVVRERKALGLHLLNFTASKTTNGSELVWETENEKFYTNFTVERSTDNGQNYALLGGFASSDEGTYSFIDRKPAITADTYRIKLEDLNGTITYSKAITLMYANVSDINNNAVNIYPNPAVNTINLAIVQNSVNLTKGANPSYSINITNSMGKVLKTITTAQPTWQENVSGLLPGTYMVDVVNNADKSAVGKAKFIKL